MKHSCFKRLNGNYTLITKQQSKFDAKYWWVGVGGWAKQINVSDNVVTMLEITQYVTRFGSLLIKCV